jgi:small subunit ribosomal protein S17
MEAREAKRSIEAVVVSDKMAKTIVVETERSFAHPQYKKTVKRKTKYKVHDEKNEAKAGDLVLISQCRPMSKDKNFRLVEIIKKAGA